MQWRLVWRGQIVGTLTRTETDMTVVSCSFEAEPAFEALRSVFDEKSRIADQLLDKEDEALNERWDELEGKTCPPALVLLDEEGAEVEFGLLYVEGARAGFRGL